jgi:excisionase family DNA binding protein
MKLLYTPLEAAAALAISRSSLYELLRTGALRSVHIGASRRIPADALDEFVTGCPHTASTRAADGR